MGGSNKKKRNKRKKSDNGDNSLDNESFKKAGKFSESPVSPNSVEEVNVSKILKEANSVLFDSDEVINLGHIFEELVQSESAIVPPTLPHPRTDMSQSAGASAPAPTNADIMNCLKSIDTKIDDMDSRLKKLESLEQKVDRFEIEMKKLWTFTYDSDKRTGNRLQQVEDKVESSDFALGVVNDKVVGLEKERNLLKDEVVYLQSQSMRNNLIFGNITEAPTETQDECEKKLREFLIGKMKIAQTVIDTMQLERVHRMGARNDRNQCRKIIAKFTMFKDRELVRKQWKTLQGTNYYVHEQFPKEVNDKRRQLLPRLKDAKKAGKRAWLAYDTLYVDGKPVKDDVTC